MSSPTNRVDVQTVSPRALPLMLACTSDLSGKVRGKAYPAAEHEARCETGIGWTPANALITCLDLIASGPYGSLGDLILRPDRDASVALSSPGGREYRFAIGDIVQSDGARWDCCLRGIAREALHMLREETGLDLFVAFEHEFAFTNDRPRGGAYSLAGFLAEQAFGETLMAMLAQAQIKPDTFLREFGDDQYEVTIKPSIGLRAADEAVILREIVRATAIEHESAVSFAPIMKPGGIGNGVHVHLSLLNAAGAPVSYDRDAPHGISALAGSFAAGMLKYLPEYVALTAPSLVSYARLVPDKWSAAFNNLGYRDREAAVRICPIPEGDEVARARQFNVEFRAADASASPYLVLACLAMAGLRGIRDGLATPPTTQEKLTDWSGEKLTAHGLQRLPQSLAEALDLFAASVEVRSWFPGGFSDVYLAHKRFEVASLEGRDLAEQCALYRKAY